MDKETVWREISELSKYYNASDRMSADVLNIYTRHLEDMDYDTFRLAVDRHIETSNWMPTVANIRDAAMKNLMEKAGVPLPAAAWGEVSRNLHDDGQENYGTLTAVNRIGDHEWSHPLVRRAAEEIGWQDMWNTKNDSMTANRARYMDAYQGLVQGLKDHYVLNPTLRMAIEPEPQPKLPEPKDKVPALDRGDFGHNYFAEMPEGAQKKLQEVRGRMEK